jgi:hypothetical protein
MSNIVIAGATDGMFAKLLTGLGLDPGSLSFIVIFNRLADAAWGYVHRDARIPIVDDNEDNQESRGPIQSKGIGGSRSHSAILAQCAIA